jgi:hypothetical protein
MLPEEKLLRFLVNNPGQHLKTEIRKRDFIPYHRPVREYKELFANTQELGREQGYQIFVEDEGNRFSIEARILEDTDPNRIPIMIAPTEGKDFREIASNTSYDYHVTKWKDLHKVVKQYAYMPQLNNGKRAKKNAIAGGVLLGLDVDDHWTLKEARKWLKEKQLQSLIITTPSHQKSVSKDGKKIEPKDKFRILILLNHPFNATAQEWSQVVENFSEEIGSVTDTSCKDISRFFFPSPDDATYYYIDGKPLDWTEYNYSHEVKDTPKLKLTDPLEKAIAYANEKYGVVSKGGRDTFLNEIWHWNRKHEGLGRQQTYDICRALNQRFCNPPFDEEYMKKWDRDE